MNRQWIDTFHQELKGFQESVSAFDRGEMDRKTYKGISGGFGTYAQRDPSRHMLRLRMAGGRLNLERLKFLADTVEGEHIGRVKLTTCQTIQLHDLTAGQVAPVMDRAADCTIYSRGGGGDHPRNVMCSPLSGVQQGERFDPTPWAEAAAAYLLDVMRDIHMPRKLKIAFSNGADDSVHAAFRDMGFTAQEDGTFSLRIAGGMGAANPRMGVLVDGAVKPAEVLYYVKAMIETFCAHGNYENRARARTRYMQDTLGEDGLREAFLANLADAKAAGGLDIRSPEAPAAPDKGDGTLDHPRAVPQKQKGLYAVKYHPIGGLLPADMPRALYELLKDMEGAEVRVAPDETLYIINLSAAEAGRVLEATAGGAETEFEHSVACVGAAVCQQGLRDSQGLLQAAVDAVRAAGIPDGALPKVRISGCPSSCSAHLAGAIGLQGSVKLVDKAAQSAYKLFLDGSDQAGEARFGGGSAVVLEKHVPAMLVELGRAAAQAGQRWAEWSAGHTGERDAIIAKYEAME